MTEEYASTTDAVKILHRRFIEGKPEMERLLEEERVNLAVGLEVYQLRNDRRLSQRELADLIGTDKKTIDDVEEADYDGNSLVYLQRIASALGKVVRIIIVDKESAATFDEQA